MALLDETAGHNRRLRNCIVNKRTEEPHAYIGPV